jgi:Zn finger protein HypA/HybF involved in hydrogenase expression
MGRKFTMIDESFICENCGEEVKKLGYTARDHCPACLYSKHVDINPGDREADCGGTLIPIGVEKAKKDGYKIVYKCEKCGEIKKNISADDDDIDEIIRLSMNPIDVIDDE